MILIVRCYKGMVSRGKAQIRCRLPPQEPLIKDPSRYLTGAIYRWPPYCRLKNQCSNFLMSPILKGARWWVGLTGVLAWRQQSACASWSFCANKKTWNETLTYTSSPSYCKGKIKKKNNREKTKWNLCYILYLESSKRSIHFMIFVSLSIKIMPPNRPSRCEEEAITMIAQGLTRCAVDKAGVG